MSADFSLGSEISGRNNWKISSTMVMILGGDVDVKI
jgi:hypothetical protein